MNKVPFPRPEDTCEFEDPTASVLLALSALVNQPWYPEELDRKLRVNGNWMHDPCWPNVVLGHLKDAGWNCSYGQGTFHIWRPFASRKAGV